MRLTKDEHTVEIDGQTVAVRGQTGRVHATWTLLVDGEPADTARAAGDFTLKGALSDGSPVEAAVHQSLVGPTEVRDPARRRGRPPFHRLRRLAV